MNGFHEVFVPCGSVRYSFPEGDEFVASKGGVCHWGHHSGRWKSGSSSSGTFRFSSMSPPVSGSIQGFSVSSVLLTSFGMALVTMPNLVFMNIKLF